MSINKALICLGANSPDCSDRLAAAFSTLTIMGAVVKATPPYLTAAEYAGDAAPYLNQIVLLATYLELDELILRTKAYESSVRSTNTHSPAVNIDIDIVEWNGRVLRPADAAAAYFRQGLDMLK